MGKTLKLLTINIVTYNRHEDIEYHIKSLLPIMDLIVLDVWSDGYDKFVEDLCLAYGAQYNYNETRANLWGHDMRDKSLQNCKTPYWYSTNDDNFTSAEIIKMSAFLMVKGTDMIKFRCAMMNWQHMKKEDYRFDYDYINEPNNINNKNEYVKLVMQQKDNMRLWLYDICPIMRLENNGGGEFDLCQFIINADFARENGGFFSRENEADSYVYRHYLSKTNSVAYIDEVLAVHN